MPLAEPFERHTDRCEAWFDRHGGAACASELPAMPAQALTGTVAAVRELEPARPGCGVGAFAVVAARDDQ
ncbi:MAG: hypothetical protein ACLGIT_15440 [Gammaproteobacteria bacterium]